MEHRIDVEVLSGEQRLVIALYYWGPDGTTEREIAEDLTDLLDEVYTRDRVHTIRRAAERRLLAAARRQAVAA